MPAQQVVVLGGGESGVGAALLAKAKGYEVFVSDLGVIKDSFREELRNAGIAFESGQHTEEKIVSADEVIKSPGIPDTVPLVQQLQRKGVPVISEIEWAARFCEAKLIGITGSNGKTTTATLLYHLLQAADFDVALAGNVGTSFARSMAQGDTTAVYVLELSSFQLDGIREFRPQIAAILNLSPDHLDRYEYQLDRYLDSKYRIAMNQQAGDVFLYYAEDAALVRGLQRNPVQAKKLALSDQQLSEQRLQTTQGVAFDLRASHLLGKHNARNALFALEIALLLEADPTVLQKALGSYRPEPNRLEPVGTIAGVPYINDSKGTNVDAVYYALEAVAAPIIWIAGGTDKGNDYAPLLPLVKDKVKALVCLGKDNSKLKAAFAEWVPTIVETQSARAAVAQAARLAQTGDTVLLSPACASFDLFQNYVDRGDQFRAAVQEFTRTGDL